MKCPNKKCGNINAYQGMLFVECPNKECQFYSKEQEEKIKQQKLNEDIDKKRSLSYGWVSEDDDTPPYPWGIPFPGVADDYGAD